MGPARAASAAALAAVGAGALCVLAARRLRAAVLDPPWRQILDFWFVPDDDADLSSLVRRRWFVHARTAAQAIAPCRRRAHTRIPII